MYQKDTLLLDLEVRKETSRLFHEAQKKARKDTCPLCGEKVSGFCNSHTVPRFVLKYIAQKGKVLQSNAFFRFDVIDIEKGINNSGAIHIICNKCDQSFFFDYENEKALLDEPTNKILAEIEVKNILMQLYKRWNEVELYKIIQQKYNSIRQKEVLDETHTLDIRDYEMALCSALRLKNETSIDAYQVIYRTVLPYVVPIALQSPISLYRDMYGNIVVDVYDLSSKERIEDMHLCIFPLNGSTVIMLFTQRENQKYDRFCKRFNRMTDPHKLQYINYLIFKYTENYYAAPSLKEEIVKHPLLQQLCKEVNDYPDFGFVGLEEMQNPPPGVQMHEIPNFLTPRYAIT